MTGAMIPEGADCVVKQEDAEWDERAVGYIIMRSPEKITAWREKIFWQEICWQKPEPGRFLSAGSCHGSRSKKPYGVQKD